MLDFRHSGVILSLECVELDSRVYGIEVFFNLNSKVNEKFELFFQRTYTSKLRNETLFIADHEDVKK